MQISSGLILKSFKAKTGKHAIETELIYNAYNTKFLKFRTKASSEFRK